ncbi:MAG: 16S rRNA (cytidine(1402)-2'-O)-methyltransferase [Salinarimonadaceae bacterium]|nr:MAG: 16S rRNA (cytidine(1402)-2'-O)-methyltransferase [Salinarimonadaceae bacterium]
MRRARTPKEKTPEMSPPGSQRRGTPPSARGHQDSKPRGEKTFAPFGAPVPAERVGPGLYVVATPIGNLKDVTLRALGVLAGVDAVLAEDTRVTRRLLSHYGITTPLFAYHEHSGDAARERALRRLREGEALALVSDAGTPLVSDPGYRLVQGAIAEGLAVTPLPGASAILSALVVGGLPSDRFFFEGFLPPRSGARKARLRELAAIPGTLVLYEAPHRLPETLADAAEVMGPRPAAMARELTKMFETVRRGSLDELAAFFAAEGPPKGEVVVLIGAASAQERREEAEQGLDAELNAALRDHSVKDAAAIVAARTGLARREVYARALALAGAGRET